MLTGQQSGQVALEETPEKAGAAKAKVDAIDPLSNSQNGILIPPLLPRQPGRVSPWIKFPLVNLAGRNNPTRPDGQTFTPDLHLARQSKWQRHPS